MPTKTNDHNGASENTHPSPPVKCCGITARQDRAIAVKASQEASEFLRNQGVEVCTLEEVLSGRPVDMMLAFGGDGTLLHSARLMADRDIPVLGVNFGRVGYLCAVTEKRLKDALEIILAGKYSVESRAMVRGFVYNRCEQVWRVDALNEILVGGSNRTLTLKLTINGEDLGTIIGDGVIVATRTGSTAYAMSAGGPVCILESMVIVPSNAIKSCLMAPAVIPISSEVEITNLTQATRPYTIADGQKDYQIEYGTKVKIRRSPLIAKFVDLGLVSPAAKLSVKFAERHP